MSDHEYSQGICGDGAAILKNGQPMTIEEIVQELRDGQSARAQGDAEPEVGAMADVLGEWVRNITGTALTHVTLVDMVRAMFATTATPQPEVDGWVKYSERLPGQLNREYLVRVNSQIHSRPRMFVAEYNEYGFDRSKVTHWMPLPSCPTPQEDSGDA